MLSMDKSFLPQAYVEKSLCLNFLYHHFRPFSFKTFKTNLEKRLYEIFDEFNANL
jgi:hypothetical protein